MSVGIHQERRANTLRDAHVSRAGTAGDKDDANTESQTFSLFFYVLPTLQKNGNLHISFSIQSINQSTRQVARRQPKPVEHENCDP